MKIIFLGTPEFAVASLQVLIENKYDVVAVVTAPDQPAGRGLQLKQSAVKEFALQHQLKVIQPVKLSDPDFLAEVKQLNAGLQIVVAFRMMPQVLWSMPVLGTFNLHASLLPQYRGAAPINRAVMNGETETGVTTFFLQQAIDTGNILFAEKVRIGEDETAGQLHDKLKEAGAALVLKTVKAIETKNYTEVPQNDLVNVELKAAPKIFKDDCKLNFSKSVFELYNQIRGLSPYPAAFFNLKTQGGKQEAIKIFRADSVADANVVFKKEVWCDDKTFLKIQCNGGYLNVKELQMAGKKRMLIDEFLRGYKMNGSEIVVS